MVVFREGVEVILFRRRRRNGGHHRGRQSVRWRRTSFRFVRSSRSTGFNCFHIAVHSVGSSSSSSIDVMIRGILGKDLGIRFPSSNALQGPRALLGRRALVAILGARGLIGSHRSRRWLDCGWVTLDRKRKNGTKVRYERWRIDPPEPYPHRKRISWPAKILIDPRPSRVFLTGTDPVGNRLAAGVTEIESGNHFHNENFRMSHNNIMDKSFERNKIESSVE